MDHQTETADLSGPLMAGVENLLMRCGGMRCGDRLLVVHEPAAQGYYGATLAETIARGAGRLGLTVTKRQVPFAPSVDVPCPTVLAEMRAAAVTVFVARLGDQLRFDHTLAAAPAIVCYALDDDMLASSFGTLDHGAMVTLKAGIDAVMAHAERIEVTCPLGTLFHGRLPPGAGPSGDTTVRRFPMSVFSPLPAGGFSGRIAQRGFLTGTGSRYYKPYSCRLNGTLMVEFDANRIVGFDGTDEDVAAARAHYGRVGETFGIDSDYVHSWHVGIHPGCAFMQTAGSDLERWSGGAFGNPRLLHFHTCGAYAPGEISLNVLDPTVIVDGVPLWERGRLMPERLPCRAAFLDDAPTLRAAFDAPAQDCGLDASGALSFG